MRIVAILVVNTVYLYMEVQPATVLKRRRNVPSETSSNSLNTIYCVSIWQVCRNCEHEFHPCYLISILNPTHHHVALMEMGYLRLVPASFQLSIMVILNVFCLWRFFKYFLYIFYYWWKSILWRPVHMIWQFELYILILWTIQVIFTY